jgi:phosphate transport system protein
MSKHLQRDLEKLQHQLLALSSSVEEMINRACRALRNKQADMAEQVIRSDNAIDQQEVAIEEECLKILALHQPVAIDLRRTATAMKVNNDLERIADLAVNIAERAVCLAVHPELEIPANLHQMAELATAMVREALDSLVRLDVHLARQVCARDERVDAFNREVIDDLRAEMHARPETIEAALHLFSAARHIERIADHATNIAEDVIYLVEGEIARHKHDDPAPPTISSR